MIENPVTKKQFQQHLDNITQKHKEDVNKQLLPTLNFLHNTIFMNIQNKPEEPKFRTIKTSSKVLQEKLFSLEGYEDLLTTAGFQKDSEAYTLPKEQFMNLMICAGVLKEHIQIIENKSIQKSVQNVNTVQEFSDSNVEELKNIIQSGQSVIIDFSAVWCGPCKRIAPVYDQMAAAYPKIKFIKVQGDKSQILSQYYQVQGFPTFVGIKNKQVIEKFSGANEQKLKDLLLKL